MAKINMQIANAFKGEIHFFQVKGIIFKCAEVKMWNASRFCVSSLRRGHANLLCIVPILVYVQPKLAHLKMKILTIYYATYTYTVALKGTKSLYLQCQALSYI